MSTSETDRRAALPGRVSVITGAGSGIGRALVVRFLKEGAAVVALDISQQRLAGLGRDLLADSDRLQLVCGDARTIHGNRLAVGRALSVYGRLDAFIANTGFWDFGLTLKDIPESGFDEGFEEIFALNVKAYLAGAKAAVPALTESSGSLVLTSSNAGLHPGGGGALYTASKHAVVGLVRQLAYELAPDVRVNAVAPGGMATALTGPAALELPAGSIDELPLADIISEVSPLGFLPEASDYAGWYVTLASATDARTMTGAIIECDGGEAVRGRAFSEHVRARFGDVRAHPTE